LPALVMIVLGALPTLASGERYAAWAAAAVSVVATWGVVRRAPPSWEPGLHRPHYMQALTQAGVFVYWGLHWEPVAHYLAPLAIQVAFAYQITIVLAWLRRRTYALGFGPVPIVFSINLFLWFKDEYFGWQLFLVALAFAGKELVQWERGGRRRHIFNPSSFGLAVMSAGLLLLGATDATLAREIAATQESPPRIFEVLFLLGLVVQLQFPVVLVTMSAAVTTWLLGAIWLRATGVYMFLTTDIPAAVFLGMLLLITDPATSPDSRAGKVLFGASYGALVFLLFPLLEAWGRYGYFDKLLPVPILNLFVRRFDRIGERLDLRLQAAWNRGAMVSPLRTRMSTVLVWVVAAVALYSTDAVGKGHRGREVAFWQRACAEERRGACNALLEIGERECEAGQLAACHDLGVDLEELEKGGRRLVGTSPDVWYGRACDGGFQPSCAVLAERRRAVHDTPAVLPGPDAVELECRGGAAAACHHLAQAYLNGVGVAVDGDRAIELFDLGCRGGLVQSCSSYAALQMERGDAAAKDRAAQAFDKACSAGDAPGCANLALMYLRGDGVVAHPARAAGLHARACDAGLAVACARLADAHDAGEGVAADPAQASRLRRRGCELGYAPACR
jgi:TPR repeat protein